LTGVVIGAGAYYVGFSIPVGLLSAGFCSMAGMLPDIDSNSSRSFQECIYFAAGLCAVMIIERMRFFGFDHNTIMLSGAITFLFVRFAIGGLVKKLTVHRGMFHSIPAALLAGELVFCLSSGEFGERIVKSFAIVAGYLSHLILDEICSIDNTGKKIKLKQSFGTALKFYDPKHLFTVVLLYLLVFFIGAGTVRNSDFMLANEQTEIDAETNPKQNKNKSTQKSIRNLIRFLAGFDDKRYSNRNENRQKFTRQRTLDPENNKQTKSEQTQINQNLHATNSQLNNLTNSTTNTTLPNTTTANTTAAPNIPLPPELLKPPANIETQIPDAQLFSQYQYQKRRNTQNTATQINQPEIIQQETIMAAADALPVVIPDENSNRENITVTNNPVTNNMDNEMTTLDVISPKFQLRKKSISPNRLPAPLN
jgi:membrane-bound metal-dependent hydrolase YbcI (DUF457 family)